MKLRMLISMAGASYSLAVRDVVEHPDADEAQRLIDVGYAEEAETTAKVTNRVIVPEIEKAVAVKRVETRKGKGA